MTLDPQHDIETWMSTELPPRPYPGLRPFGKDEWPIFFGRETVVDEVIGRLIDQHMVSIHGSSGSGKSSLVRAGILPRLEQDHASSGLAWRTCVMVPGNAPLRRLAEALASLNDGVPGAESVLAVRRLLNRGNEAGPALSEMLRRGTTDHLCVLIDQFEELFTFARTNRDEALLFTEILVGLVEKPSDGLYAMLTMRSDYLGECARFPGLAEAVNRTQYLLPQMNQAALLRAIREPAELYQGNVSRELATRLIVETSGEQDALPLIQHGLLQLWQDKGHHKSLQNQDYFAAGGLGWLLSVHADRVMAVAAPPDQPTQQKWVESLFRALIDPKSEGDAVRRPQSFAELCAVTGAAPDKLRAIIDCFRAEGASFLRPYGAQPIDDDTEIDISHEALIRWWRKIAGPQDGWLYREFRDGLIWRSLLVAADSFKEDSTSVLAPTVTEEREQWLAGRNEAWCERYGGGWERVGALIKASREAEKKARDDAEAELRRARALAKAQSERADVAEAAAAGLVKEQFDRAEFWRSWAILAAAILGVAAAVALAVLVARFW